MTTNINNSIEAIEESYAEQIESLADRVRNEVVIPYCNKYKLEFLSGNGTFGFWFTELTPASYRESHEGYYPNTVDRDRLPKRILSILETETYFGRACLAESITSYKGI